MMVELLHSSQETHHFLPDIFTFGRLNDFLFSLEVISYTMQLGKGSLVVGTGSSVFKKCSAKSTFRPKFVAPYFIPYFVLPKMHQILENDQQTQ